MATEQQERTRAAWESATVTNLGPLLTDEQNEKVWAAILAHRESGDSAAFAKEMHLVLLGTPTAYEVFLRSIVTLQDLAASAAKE